jgi:hypothetical protein
MAIRAADITFRNLVQDLAPRSAIAKHLRYLMDLDASHVIELKDDRVAFPAIRAWIFLEMGKYSPEVLFFPHCHPGGSLGDIVGLVTPVVVPLVDSVAWFAFRLQPAPVSGEFRNWAIGAACVAVFEFHAPILANKRSYRRTLVRVDNFV